MSENRSSVITSQLFMGFIILGVGVIFLLDRLDILEADSVLRLWPALLVVFGIIKLFRSRSASGRFFGLILTGSGTMLLLDRLGYTNFNFSFGDFIVIVLIGLGISLIWSSAKARKSSAVGDEMKEEGESFINSFVFMGGVNRKTNSQSFRGGELSAIMGGIELDLTEAQIQDSPAVINIFTFWGGIEIKIPRNWRLEVEGYPILGGIGDETRQPQDVDTKTLIIRGYAIMGGVDITN